MRLTMRNRGAELNGMENEANELTNQLTTKQKQTTINTTTIYKKQEYAKASLCKASKAGTAPTIIRCSRSRAAGRSFTSRPLRAN